jgi:hypothetical protein
MTGVACQRGHVSPRYTINNQCKACNIENTARRKAEDPERYAQKQRECSANWRDKSPEKIKKYREENRDKLTQKTYRWREENYERYRSTANDNRRLKPNEKVKQAAKKWRVNNKHKILAYNSARRASKSQATPPWLTKDHLREISETYKDARLMQEATGIEHHVDHIEPLLGTNSCGLHVPWNLQILTAEENLRKGNRLAA